MCECLDPVKHHCGAWLVFIGVQGSKDVYYCNGCEANVFLPCVLVESV